MTSKNKRAWSGLFVAVLLFTLLLPARVSAAVISVSDFDELTAALENNLPNIDVVITDPIVMREIIEIPAEKNVTISSASVEAGLMRGAGITGDLITVQAGAKLTLSDIVIDGNKSIVEDAGGALISVLTGGELVLEDGAVLQNNQRTSVGSRGGGVNNAGIFTMNGGVIKDNYSRLIGGGVYSVGLFKMYDGVISGNATKIGSVDDSGQVTIYMCYGGGIGIFGAGTAEIYGGTITNNESAIGAGIYTNFGTTLTIYNALITGNSASYLDVGGAGGGLWICGTGGASVYDFRSAAIYDNYVEVFGGQDIYSQEKSDQGTIVLNDTILGGGHVAWLDEANANAPLDTTISWDTLLTLTADISQSDKEAAKDAATVLITNNKGVFGGGMGINGVVYFGQTAPEKIDLVVKKTWVDYIHANHPDITVYLVINGEKQTGQSVVLNQGNGWENSFTDLPYKVSGEIVRYTVEEDIPQGYIAEYAGPFINLAGQYEIQITNTHDLVALNLTGTKTLATADGVTEPVKEGKFVFTWTSDGSNPADGCNWNGSNPVAVKAGGAIDFGTLVFKKEGTYIFTISEMDLGEEEIIYDEDDVTVTVVVERNGGLLKIVSTTYSKGGEAADGIRFANRIKQIILPEERPLTGDSGSWYLWLSLMTLSMIGCGGVAVAASRRRKIKI